MRVGRGAVKRARLAHIFEHEATGHYVEPEWCSSRLFEEEKFVGAVDDPCCGFGTIPRAAAAHGIPHTKSDLVDHNCGVSDFFTSDWSRDNIVCNPPFHIVADFTLHALQVASRKVAIIFPVARLNAAHWIAGTPLARVWLMTPRPSMPPGHVIAAGHKPQGGKMDFCWLVFDHAHKGNAELRWLRRDKVQGPRSAQRQVEIVPPLA